MAEESKINDGLLSIGPWPDGVNSVSPDISQPETSLRQASNIDLDDEGYPSDRSGYTLEIACSDGHSLYADGDIAYFVDATSLKKVTVQSGSLVEEVLQTGLENRSMGFVKVNDAIYFSNGINTGVIRDSVVEIWGVEIPATYPDLSAVSGGQLDGGIYQIYILFKNYNGEISGGVQRPKTITLIDGQGISLTNIPVPVSSEVEKVQVYRSTANGTVLYLCAEIAAGTTSYTVTKGSGLSIDLKTLFREQMSAYTSDLLAHYNGRILSAIGNVVYASDALRYGLIHVPSNFILFPETVTNIVPVTDGIYVTADKTYFIAAAFTEQQTQRVVLDYGAVRKTFIKLSASANQDSKYPTAAWWSHKGLCFASDGGVVRNISQDRIADKVFSEGSLVFREIEGVRQVLSALKDTSKPTSGFASTDIVEAEVIRNGIRIY